MMKGRRIVFILVLIAAFFISTLSAHAALELRGTDSQGNRLIYDTDFNITWYDYTRPYDTWQGQMNWAAALTVDFSGITYDDWRLPTTVDGPYRWGYDGTTTAGYNITSSEMGHLFYIELRNKGAYAIDGTAIPTSEIGLNNTGDFQNLGRGGSYWSGTNFGPGTFGAWYFYFGAGWQNYNWEEYDDWYPYHYGIAVRDGDVASTIVPEPVSSILFITGGALLAGRRLLKKKA